MGKYAVVYAAFALISASAAIADPATSTGQHPVMRSASGTVIQPTQTIIHNRDGSTTVIVVPRRSFLDIGTDVPLGYGSRMDYAFPPFGDPGRQYWYFGPDTAGTGGSPLAQPYLIPGYVPGAPRPY
jgi:hypothetical protein